jgi:hypothetical protein
MVRPDSVRCEASEDFYGQGMKRNKPQMQLPQPAIGHVLKHLPRLQEAFGRWPTYFVVVVALISPWLLALALLLR